MTAEDAACGTCLHCDLPVSGGPYCCIGCRLAASVGGGSDEHGLLEARLLLSAFLAMGVMTFSLVLYGESVYAPANDGAMDVVRDFGRMALAVFSLPVFVLLGVPLARGAWEDLRAGRIRMDGLILIATVAAYGLSLAHTFGGGGEVYYETATMVLVLVTFGRRLEARSRTHGRDAAERLAECLPERAHRVGDDDLATDVDPRELQPGDIVRVLPGEAAPADVVVLEGISDAAAAHLTGEETARPVGPGDAVPAGAVVGRGALLARVERAAMDGSLGRIRELLEAPITTTGVIRRTDRLAGRLATVAILLAVAGGFRSFAIDGAGAAVRTALSVLLVACPCALGLATPLAYRAIRAALARRSVLVRNAVAMETLPSITHVLLDKTGTLTDTASAVVARSMGSDSARRRMDSLIATSGHPLARSLPEAVVAASSVQVVPGSGVTGEVDGVNCRAGSPAWIDDSGARWDDSFDAWRKELAADGTTVVAYAEGDEVRALVGITHALRPGAKEAVDRLRARRLQLEVLSGDVQASAIRTADELGVRGRGGLTPDAKMAHVTRLQREDARTLFAGDGVNDAPAIRAADVGVAIADGTALARSQADVELLGGDLRALPALFDAADELRRTVRGNIVWSVAYNAIALGFAVAGLLHPLVAVAAMIGSSLAVSARSYRLLEWEPPGAAA